MREADERDVCELLDYLREDMANALYLYMDIGKYGVQNENIRIWIEEENEKPVSLVMKYHSSFQIYARRPGNCLPEICTLIREWKPEMISGPTFLIQSLQREIIGEYTFGSVFQIQDYQSFDPVFPIEPAREEDASEIARLMCMDPAFGKQYSVEHLERQLQERMITGMGRNYVIRQQGEIIAHIATFAEYEQIAITSGLIVHPCHRKVPYGMVLESYLFHRLLEEGKQVYTQIHDPRRVRLVQMLGGTIKGEYGTIRRMRLENAALS